MILPARIVRNRSRRDIRTAIFLLAIVTSLSGCSTLQGDNGPVIATITTDRPLGGEARFMGKLRFQNGCLVAVVDGKVATPVFDRGVVLQSSKRAIYDWNSNVQVPIGVSFSAAAAWLRDGGTGWPIAHIEGIYGAHIPEGCPAETIVKLHGFRLLAAR